MLELFDFYHGLVPSAAADLLERSLIACYWIFISSLAFGSRASTRGSYPTPPGGASCPWLFTLTCAQSRMGKNDQNKKRRHGPERSLIAF